MGCWSAENATKAYLSALKMGERSKEPDVAEFISALAAGNNAQLMVVVSAGKSLSNTLALVAAARQTGGQIVCISPNPTEHDALGQYGNYHIEFIIGEDPVQCLLMEEYREADFVLIDCDVNDREEVFNAAARNCGGGALVVGYNAAHEHDDEKGFMWWNRLMNLKTHFLPIGDGLLVGRVGTIAGDKGSKGGKKRSSRWVVKVDKCTGEEHVFRITSYTY